MFSPARVFTGPCPSLQLTIEPRTHAARSLVKSIAVVSETREVMETKTTQDVTELLGIYWHLLQRGDIASARATRHNLQAAKLSMASAEQTLRIRMKLGVEAYLADLHALHTTPAIKFWLRLVLHISLLVIFCGRQLTRAQVTARRIAVPTTRYAALVTH